MYSVQTDYDVGKKMIHVQPTKNTLIQIACLLNVPPPRLCASDFLFGTMS